MSASGAIMGTYEATERLLQSYLPPERVGIDHGGNPRTGRPQHVGEALQRPGGGARQLSQERIPADRRRSAVEDRPGTRRPRACHPAGRSGARRRQPHAAHGGGAEGSPGARRTDAAHRIHVEPVANPPARRARSHGRDLQQFRPANRDAVPDGARRGQSRKRRAHQDPDVHLRRSDPSSTPLRRRR